MNPLRKHIYLTGFMGSGKSTVGRKLAAQWKCPFIDTDHEIEKLCGGSIVDIFKNEGEDFFRAQEKKLLRRFSMQRPSVISAGGGMVLSVLNREIFRKGYWVNLKVSPITAFKRIALQKTRPLLGEKVKLVDIEMWLQRRRPYYDLAPYQVDTDQRTPRAVADEVLHVLAPDL